MADPNETPQDSANSTLPYSFGIASKETGNNNTATNSYYPVANGGPLGPHQFLASTWRGFMSAHPELFQGMTQDEALARRTDPKTSAIATDWLAGENSRVLQRNGLIPTPQNLAVAHAFGGAGASGLLKQPDTATLPDALHATQPGMADTILRLNPQYEKMTVGDIKGKYAFLNGSQYSSPSTAAPVPAPAPDGIPAVTPEAGPAPATPATSGGLAASSLWNNPQLAQMQRLAMLNRLMPQQAAPPNYAAAANSSSPTAWANALLASGQQSNPLQVLQQVQALKYLQQNGGSLLG